MRILLLGEYSNVHATLAKGLRTIGHQVTVASNGDFWKNYPRDIDLRRHDGRLGGARLMLKTMSCLPRFTGYDVVQIINPLFLELKAQRIYPVYRWLRRFNRKMVMGAFGMDYYWVHECIARKHLRYGDFNIGDQLRDTPEARREIADWIGTPKAKLNQMIAADCDHIVTGLYEYHSCYEPLFPDKTTFIPYPIEMPENTAGPFPVPDKLRVFIGINKERSKYKGTDIMLEAAREVEAKYPERMQVVVAESVPFAQYKEMVNGSHAILDQLYSYTPSMNPLMAMSKGIICIGGGEPENYEILSCDDLRPIVNVQPTKESVHNELERLLMNLAEVPKLQHDSIEYVRRYHDHIHVARLYEQLYKKI